MASDQANQSADTRLTPQSQITSQRMARAAISFGIGVTGALFLGTGGGTAVAHGLGVACLTAKTTHIGIKHVNGYRRSYAASLSAVESLFNAPATLRPEGA